MSQEEKQPFLIVVSDDALTPAKIAEGLADRSVVKIEFQHEDGSISSGYVFGNGAPMREINDRRIAEQGLRESTERIAMQQREREDNERMLEWMMDNGVFDQPRKP